MSDATPETVQVPVELLKRIHDYLDDEPYRIKIEALFPAPKPRLVAFSFDTWLVTPIDLKTYIDALPDLFTTLDTVIDEWEKNGLGDSDNDADWLKTRIRAAFGVES